MIEFRFKVWFRFNLRFRLGLRLTERKSKLNQSRVICNVLLSETTVFRPDPTVF